jgi:hypothetical protein
MHLISHRGNLTGPSPREENHPDYISKAISKGFEVEIDVWRVNNKWVLGHDEPQYEIEQSFLTPTSANRILWLHMKNIEALHHASGSLVELSTFFWHQSDDFTLTSDGHIWTYPGKKLTNKSICVLPGPPKHDILLTCAGICSDYIEAYKR